MASECVTVKFLRRLSAEEATAGDGRAVGAATSALKIISDIREYSMTPIDVICLHWLLDSISREGHSSLLLHLQDETADCDICAALATKMNLREARSMSVGS